MRDRLPRRRSSLAALARSRGPSYAMRHLRKRLRSNPSALREIEEDADWLTSSREVWGGIQTFEPSEEIDSLLESDRSNPNDLVDSINLLRRRRNPVKFRPEFHPLKDAHPFQDDSEYRRYLSRRRRNPVSPPKYYYPDYSEDHDTDALIQTAYDWHGGQWSALYSFASTGGVVHSEEHRERILSEIAQSQKSASRKEKRRLQALEAYVESAPVKLTKAVRRKSSRRNPWNNSLFPAEGNWGSLYQSSGNLFSRNPNFEEDRGDDEDTFFDQPDAEPEEEDYLTDDYKNFYQSGKLVVQVPDDGPHGGNWRHFVGKHMEANEFWPNVWWLSDHGNAHLLSLKDEDNRKNPIDCLCNPCLCGAKCYCKKCRRRNPAWGSSLFPANGNWGSLYQAPGSLYQRRNPVSLCSCGKRPVGCGNCAPCKDPGGYARECASGLCSVCYSEQNLEMLWCEPCQSYHAEARDAAHHQKLQCRKPLNRNPRKREPIPIRCSSCGRTWPKKLKNDGFLPLLFDGSGYLAGKCAECQKRKVKNPVGESIYDSIFSRKNPWLQEEDFSEQDLDNSFKKQLTRRRNPIRFQRGDNPWL